MIKNLKINLITLSLTSILLLPGCSNDTTNTQPVEVELTNEEEVLLTLSNLENEVITNLKGDFEFKETAKNHFITLIDFIFYGTTINGITFDELSEESKKQVLEIANNIDNSIINYFPNYKEEFNHLGKDMLNTATDLIEQGVSDIKNFSQENLNPDTYNNIVETKDEIINTANDLVNDGEVLLDEGKEYIKEWYSDLKN